MIFFVPHTKLVYLALFLLYGWLIKDGLLAPFQVANLKKAIKASSSQEVEDQHMSDSREMEAQAVKPAKKSSKIKG